MIYEYKTLAVTKDAGIITVMMNRPDVLNAINSAMHEELEDVWRVIQHDPETRVVVLTGAGRAFSAGGDFKEANATRYNPLEQNLFKHARQMVVAMLDISAPIIAAINGDALGLGANLALLSDVVFAARSARIGDPHVVGGAVAGDGGAVIWPLLCGISRAKRYLMTGELLAAVEAERIGLVTHLVEDGQALNAAHELAERLRDLPPLAVQGTKHAVNQLLRLQLHQTFDVALGLEIATLLSSDRAEAVTSLIDKRKATFRGK